MLHGIYGSGANLRTVARQLVAQRPDWSVLLVDLRGHGRSEHGEPPHTVDACAADVAALAMDAIAGHSFGGKVALVARRHRAFVQTWVLDATPSARVLDPDSSVAQVLALLERLPRAWAHRDDFVRAVVAAGQPEPLARWLAMNVRDGVLALDVGQVRALLDDYARCDAWDVADDAIFVVADRSTAVSPADVRRMTRVHHVDAGHWLHADDPDAVVTLLARGLGGDS
jgi:pimeloyl-ACP methyl ester carboxylesterase